MTAQKIRVLIVGTLPPPMGGTSVLLKQLYDGLKTNEEISVSLVSTSKISRVVDKSVLTRATSFFEVLWSVFWATPKVDVVSLHVGLGVISMIGLPVWLFARLFRKPLIIRRFGGNDHTTLTGIKYLITDKVIRSADVYLVETKILLEQTRALGIENVQWYSNSRPPVRLLKPPDKRYACNNFLYLSHIRVSKGVLEIIEAAQRFHDDVHVDFYGPFFEGLNEDVFAGKKNVSYCGEMPHEKLAETLAQYDALLLPTFYPGEGYPGIVLEAFSAGMPVIATRWRALPEIIDEDCGIMVEPRDADSLFKAMDLLHSTPDLYRNLCYGALAQHKKFDSTVWESKFIDICYSLVENKNSQS
jgi:glycosyltransferase involved in cell wall biosynthesis